MRSSPLAGAVCSVPLALALSAGTARAAIATGYPCDPLTFGAVGDGVTDNTTAIQSAINACARAGGGLVRLRVVNGRGIYLTSPIRLVSHVGLQLDAGVTLLGTTDHTKYHIAYINYPYHANEALVSAVGAVDTGIIGSGTIDGQGGITAADGGLSWWKLTQAPGETVDEITYYTGPYTDIPTSNGVPRPWLVEFYQCSNVSVNGITLRNSPMWNLVFRYSTNITASEDTITVTPNPSTGDTDGIDVIGSSHLTLINLNISSGGDSVALKSGLPVNVPKSVDPNEAGLPQLATHDVVIVNSTFSNGNGIAIGAEAANGVYNVVARNIVETGTGYGLAIKSGRARGNYAAGEYNIMAQNLTLTGVRQPFVISAYGAASDRPADAYDPPRAVTALTPNIHDISISGLTATGATGKSLIVGLPESCIRNVILDNVNIATRSTGIQLRNMTGAFANVTSMPGSGPPFVVQENVTVTATGTTSAITNTPPETVTTPPGVSCSGNPQN